MSIPQHGRSSPLLRRVLIGIEVALAVIVLGGGYVITLYIRGYDAAVRVLELALGAATVGLTIVIAWVGVATLRINERLTESTESLTALEREARQRESASFAIEYVRPELQSAATDDVEFLVSNVGWKPSGIRRTVIVLHYPEGDETRELDVVRRRRLDASGYEEYAPPLDAGDQAIYRARLKGSNPKRLPSLPATLKVTPISGDCDAEFKFTYP